MTPDPGMPAALARLRAYLAATPPGTPADWEREGLPPSVYGAVPRLAPAPPPPEGVGWDAETRPGPQPENAGLTPGWPPEPPPPPELAAAVGELAHAARVAERVGAAARRAEVGQWDIAQALAGLEARVEQMAAELERMRGIGTEPDGASPGGRGGPSR